MSATYVINLSISLSALVITFVLVIVCAVGADLKATVNRWFFALVLLNMFIILAEFAVGLLQGHTGPAATAAIRTANYLSFALPGVQIAVYGIYLYKYLSTRVEITKLPVYLIGACGACTVLLAAAAEFNDLYSWFDANNYFHEQDTFWISHIFPALFVSVAMATTLRHIRELKAREWSSLLIYVLLPLVCYFIEMSNAGIWISHFGATVSIFIIYVNIQLELKNQMKSQEAELLENRVAVMLSQIQPHFLYNSLTAISRLCCDNPAAHKALIAFSEYLRGNMDSISRKAPIPFEKELEHVKQYLWLEELRFEERLHVEYEIGASGFMLPVLTLQPIVENAVRHGVTKKRSGGTVTIRTEATGNGHRVSVIDDGVGFDVNEPPRDDRSHMGIENVRSRLAALCGGTLAIESTPGEGTVAVIEIPRGGVKR